MDPQVFEVVHPLNLKTSDEQWLMRPPLLPHVHNHLFGLVSVEGEVVVSTPRDQTVHLPPVVHLVSASDASNHGGVIGELNDGVVRVGSDAVVGEQGVEDGAEDTALRGPDVGDYSG